MTPAPRAAARADLFRRRAIAHAAAVDSSANPASRAASLGRRRSTACSCSRRGAACRCGPRAGDSKRCSPASPVASVRIPGDGVWMEAIVPDEAGAWYGYYHHERPADLCGRPERQLPRLGAMRSADNGADVGRPRHRSRRAAGQRGLRLEQSLRARRRRRRHRRARSQRPGPLPLLQPVLARCGRRRASPWRGWRGPIAMRRWGRQRSGTTARGCRRSRPDESAPFSYPAGTPLVKAAGRFTIAPATNDVFWGASIHWNTYLEQYVMLLNRAKDDQFGQEGIYVAFSPRSLSRPAGACRRRSWMAARGIRR